MSKNKGLADFLKDTIGSMNTLPDFEKTKNRNLEKRTEFHYETPTGLK